MKKWINRLLVGIVVLIIIIITVVNVGMSAMELSDEDTNSYFEEKAFEGLIETVEINNRKVKVISDLPQDSDSILIVFIHGAPGSWDAFKEYLTDKDISQNARVIAYDRPGYGGSDKTAMPGIAEQTEILKEIIKRNQLEKTILVGHSYGGPIAGMAGLDKELDVDAVIMIAPLVDPMSEPIFWYSYFSYWKLTSWVLPSNLVVAGSEKFAHSNELKKMQPQWHDANTSFVHVHGMKDALAPGKENIAFSRANIPEDKLETIVYDDKGHLVIWTEYHLMKEIIVKAIEKLK